MIEQRIRARVGAYSVPAVVHAVQGDTGRVFVFELEDYTVTGAEGASLNCMRPDGSFYTYAGTVSTEDNTVTVALDVEGGALTQEGVVTFQLELVEAGLIVCTFRGSIIVEPVVGGEATQEEKDFRDAIQAQLNNKASNAQLAQEILDRTAADATKANKSTTINGKSLAKDRVIYAQDIPADRKNLMANVASSQTVNGLTFTVNDDLSITVTGTASARTDIQVGILTVGGSVILSGCPSGGSNTTYELATKRGGYYQIEDFGNGVTTQSAQMNDEVYIIIRSGYAISGSLVFRPMIRLASIEDDSYVPFSKTAVEISKDLYAPLFQRIGVNYGNVTIDSTGFLALNTSLIPSAPTGYTLLFATVETYNTNSPKAAFAVNRTGRYVYGSAGTINALQVSYFFIRTSVLSERS